MKSGLGNDTISYEEVITFLYLLVTDEHIRESTNSTFDDKIKLIKLFLILVTNFTHQLIT